MIGETLIQEKVKGIDNKQNLHKTIKLFSPCCDFFNVHCCFHEKI